MAPWFVLLLVALVLSAGSAGWVDPAATSTDTTQQTRQIDSCTAIDEPGEYVLTADVTESEADVCFNVQADDVVLDGAGHAVAGINQADTVGVRANGTNVTVTNLTVTNWTDGVHYRNTTDGAIRDVTARDNARNGVTLIGTAGTVVIGATAVENGLHGIGLRETAHATVTDATVVNNTHTGVIFFDSSDGLVQDVTARSNGQRGIAIDVLDLEETERMTVEDSVAANNGRNGVELSNASDSRIANVTAQANEVTGILLLTSKDVTVTRVVADENGLNGINFEGERATIEDSVAANNGQSGIFAFDAADSRVENVTARGNGLSGVELVGTRETSVRGVTTDGNTRGVATFDADRITVTDATITNSAVYGVLIRNTTNSRVANVATDASADWAFASLDDSGDNTVSNFTAGTTTVSFTGKDVGLQEAEAPASPPGESRDIGTFVDTESMSDASWLTLGVHYADEDIQAAGVAETSLRLWRFDGGQWTEVADSSVDTEANIVSAQVTEFGILAPLGTPSGTTGAVTSDKRTEPPVPMSAFQTWVPAPRPALGGAVVGSLASAPSNGGVPVTDVTTTIGEARVLTVCDQNQFCGLTASPGSFVRVQSD